MMYIIMICHGYQNFEAECRPAELRFFARIIGQVVVDPCVQSRPEAVGDGPKNWLQLGKDGLT